MAPPAVSEKRLEAAQEQAPHGGQVTAQLPCRYGCEKTYTHERYRRRHEKRHNRPHKCPHESCRYHPIGFPNEDELCRHIEDKHDRNIYFQCPYCQELFGRESNCKVHMEGEHKWLYIRCRSKARHRSIHSASSSGSFTGQPVHVGPIRIDIRQFPDETGINLDMAQSPLERQKGLASIPNDNMPQHPSWQTPTLMPAGRNPNQMQNLTNAAPTSPASVNSYYPYTAIGNAQPQMDHYMTTGHELGRSTTSDTSVLQIFRTSLDRSSSPQVTYDGARVGHPTASKVPSLMSKSSCLSTSGRSRSRYISLGATSTNIDEMTEADLDSVALSEPEVSQIQQNVADASNLDISTTSNTHGPSLQNQPIDSIDPFAASTEPVNSDHSGSSDLAGLASPLESFSNKTDNEAQMDHDIVPDELIRKLVARDLIMEMINKYGGVHQALRELGIHFSG